MRASETTGLALRAPDNEFDVSPEMVEVGLCYLFGYRHDRGIIEEDYVAEMYRAMCRARVTLTITPEMIRAGADAFLNWGNADSEVAAYSIFTAMLAASPALAHLHVVDQSS